MKRNILLLVAMVFMTACGGNTKISLEEAQTAALKESGVTDAKFTKGKLETENGRAVYDIEFISSGEKWEYEIDGETGAVIKFERERSPLSQFKEKQTEALSQPTSEASQNEISSVMAEDIALNDSNVARENAKLLKSHIDYDDGRKVYEVEFVYNYTEYDYDIDATTGEIISKDIDK